MTNRDLFVLSVGLLFALVALVGLTVLGHPDGVVFGLILAGFLAAFACRKIAEH